MYKHIDGTERPCDGLSESGSTDSPGTAGAPGRSTHVSDLTGPALIAVSTTPDDGLNTFQGRAWLTSWQLRGVQEGVFTLTASFDLETALRLKESLSSIPGNCVTEGTECFPMTLILELPTT